MQRKTEEAGCESHLDIQASSLAEKRTSPSLWQDATQDSRQKLFNSSVSVSQANSRRGLELAKEGRYSDAINALRSQGCASTSNTPAIKELKSRLPVWSNDIPLSLTAESQTVLSTLESFPRGSSLGTPNFKLNTS